MGRKLDLVGRRYGRLIVVKDLEYLRSKSPVWLCKCDCGSEHNARSIDLQRGGTRSCGCLDHEVKVKRFLTHGRTDTTEYSSWEGMKDRCCNPNNPRYKDYGGRGITVCDRWLHSFENFYTDMGDRPSPTHSIDRIDNDAGYSPDNCRWATKKEQTANRRKPKKLGSGMKQ